MDKIYGQNLEPFFTIAEEEARKSPCKRRQYAALIGYEDINHNPMWVLESNSRYSNCCNTFCVRDTFKFKGGERVELGAEVHAESAALISAKETGQAFILVGYQGNRPLFNTEVYPCHTCALNIKFAGYKYIYIRKQKGTISPVSIAEIIEYREQQWYVEI